MSAYRILIIEDDSLTNAFLADLLASSDYRTLQAFNGSSGLESARKNQPDLIIVDWHLPDLNGPELCQQFRRLNLGIPILMLTGESSLDSQVSGLESGADDYLSKPVNPKLLLARIKALLRRARALAKQNSVWKKNGLRVDFQKKTVVRDSQPVALNSKEFGMLQLMYSADGAPVSREQFLSSVWGYTYIPTTRTVDNYIKSLREKIEPDPSSPTLVLTVKGTGYKLVT